MTTRRGQAGMVIVTAMALSLCVPACDALLVGGLQVGGVCENGKTRCADDTPETCNAGAWVPMAPCQNGEHCRAGACTVECTSGDVRCFGNTPEACVGGVWQAQATCVHQTCVLGACAGDCALGDATCAGKTPQICGAVGEWKPLPDCAGDCVAGSCPGPSCAGLAATCGPNHDENCCLSPLVPGGSYNRGNDQGYPATVSDFRLDKFEITVGRFRAFVQAFMGSTHAPGAGAHPLIPDSGWSQSWDSELTWDAKAWTSNCSCRGSCMLTPTWNDPGGSADRPMNCLSWYEAFAFCAWDGGRLPTEAEWGYAAVGGSEQRGYPWGDALPSRSLAVYECTGEGSKPDYCTSGDIPQVGLRSPDGDGKWRHADLAGSMGEWVLDAYVYDNYSYAMCIDCADTQFMDHNRLFHGGGWRSPAPNLSPFVRKQALPSGEFQHWDDIGVRCARSP